MPGSNDSTRVRLDRWQRFLQPDAPPGRLFLIDYQERPTPAPRLWPEEREKRVDWAWNRYEQACERLTWLHDDSIPNLKLTTGTEIFAEALGCEVYRPDDGNPSARPLIDSAREVDKVRVPEVSRSPLAYLFEMADELRRRGGPEAILGLLDIQSPMDIAALVWEKTSFLVAMLDEPNAVRALAAKCGELLTATLDQWFHRYGTEYVAHFPAYPMSGGMTLSEDEIGAVSAEMFGQFFADELASLSARYGGLGIHCCAHAKHQWENLRQVPGLRLLNLVQPPEVVPAALEFFGNSVVQMHHGWRPATIAEAARHPALQGKRVVLQFSARTKDEALRLNEELQHVRASGVGPTV